MCAVKSCDFFKQVKNGSVNIVTDHIDHFTGNGIKPKSDRELRADIIVTAIGLNMELFDGIDIFVDGEKFEATETMNYKGVMLENLPNMSMTFGYTNASWTLKADLTSEFVCRTLSYMNKNGFTIRLNLSIQMPP